MNTQFLIAKVLGTHTENSWAQVYSTQNLFIALGLSSDESHIKSITTIGKELLERLQREFYALDEKSLARIKEAVTKALSEIPNHVTFSIILTTIIDNVVYIITAGEGVLTIKRGNNFGNIAIGEKGEIVAFSGKAEKDDILILQTSSFSKKVNTSTLISNSLPDIFSMAENITPIILQNQTGDEAALLVQYKVTDEEKNILLKDDSDSEVEEKKEKLSLTQKIYSFLSKKKPNFSNLSNLPDILNTIARKKVFIPILIVFLLILLGGFILFEQKNKEQEEVKIIFNEKFLEAQKKYDEGIALETLNANLALSNLSEAKQILDSINNSYPLKTLEKERLNNLSTLIDQKIQAIQNQPQPTP